MPNNEFRPNDLVTRAEFATALSRMLYSTPDGNPYYVPHIEKLKSE
ncbi:S-layer homology domain-containing protein [bacterium]|nr:S-layer homology domain-containing protein [bacterium]